MNITPWVLTCSQKGMSTDQILESLSEYGNFLLAPPSRMSFRSIKGASTSWYGIKFQLGRMTGGIAEESYAWDELDTWSVVPPSWHTWSWAISCDKFYLYELHEEACMHLYNHFLFLSCFAHFNAHGRYPLMKQGVFLGYLRPDQRQWYDQAGFPNDFFSSSASTSL